MTDTTPRLGLATVVAAQAQKHVTVNEDLMMLDVLHDCLLKSMALSVPPTSPADGDCYLVAQNASGAWVNNVGRIACCCDGGWRFLTVFAGLRAYNAADGRLYLYTGDAWKVISNPALDFPADGTLATLEAEQQWSAVQHLSAGITVGHTALSELSPYATLATGSTTHNYLTISAPFDMQSALVLGDQTNGTDCVLYRPGGSQDLRVNLCRAGDILAITQSGAVGIGTVTPAEKLSVNGNIAPAADNSFSFGTAAKRASVVYAATGTINTSASSEKCSVRVPDTAEIACAREIAENICLYQWKEAVAAKGTARARLHCGWVADGESGNPVTCVQEICTRHGLDPQRYVFFCRDDNGTTVRYGLRYSELMAFVLAAEHSTVTALAARVAALEASA